MVYRIRTQEEIDEEQSKFVYIPPARFKVGDKVLLIDHPVRWGLPLDFDMTTVLPIVKESFYIHAHRNGWTATIKYNNENYEIYEESLSGIIG